VLPTGQIEFAAELKLSTRFRPGDVAHLIHQTDTREDPR
jgi:hypothetical protein